MTEHEYAELRASLAANQQEHESFKRRLSEVERASKEHGEIMLQMTRQNAAIESILKSQERAERKIDRVDSRVSALEAEPGDRWRRITLEAIVAAVAAVVGMALGKMMGGGWT